MKKSNKETTLKEKITKKKFSKEIGQRIKYFRNRRGLTMQNISDATGYSTSYIGYLELGQNTASTFILYIIAEALGVPVENFFPPNEIKDEELTDAYLLDNKDFKPYLEIAKKAFYKEIDPDKLQNSLDIFSK